MKTSLPFLLLWVPLLAACPPKKPTTVESAAPAPAEDPMLQRGRQFATWYTEKSFQALFDNASAELQKAVPLDAWSQVHNQLQSQFGREVELKDEHLIPSQDHVVYHRIAAWDGAESTLNSYISISPNGKLIGFFIKPTPKVADSAFLEYQTKTDLRLPFTGEWWVFWGGRSVEKNYHAAYPDQRFALDLVIRKENKNYKTDGKTNEDYYAFSQPVLAPGAGVIVSVTNDVIDNIPGQMNPKQATGNHVIIDHENGEFSLLAHFKQGSITVKAGDRIAAGDPLGQCGNSGNTSESHIHYHMQDTPDFGKGAGMPLQFQNYRSNGKPVARGEVEQGQFIEPQPTK